MIIFGYDVRAVFRLTPIYIFISEWKNIRFIFKGNTTTTDVDFFDSAFTFSNESIEVGCCGRDTSLTNVTCGRGTSCTGQCSAIEASLCPSGNCTADPEDCNPNLLLTEEGEEDHGKRRYLTTQPSWAFKWCTQRCPVRYHPSCCFHPTCRWRKRNLCSWMNYLTGDPLFLNFDQTTPQATPVPNLAAFPTASGAARCRKSQFLTPLSWTERPTPTRVS